MVLNARNADTLATAAETLRAEGARVHAFAFDVTDGTAVAKGIAAIGSEELAGLAGMRSADADAQLGRAAGEAVHRDMLVLV